MFSPFLFYKFELENPLFSSLKNYSSISQKEVAQNAQPLVFY